MIRFVEFLTNTPSSAEVVLSLSSNILFYPLSSEHTHTPLPDTPWPPNLSVTSERQQTRCCSAVSEVFENEVWGWLVAEMREFYNAAEESFPFTHTDGRIPGVRIFDPGGFEWEGQRSGTKGPSFTTTSPSDCEISPTVDVYRMKASLCFLDGTKHSSDGE